MYTKQQILDISCRQIIRQGYKQSLDEDGHCAYRGAEGRMCAAGPFTEEDVVENIGVGSTEADGRYVVRLINVSDHDRSFLSVLQSAHDHYLDRGAHTWEGRIREVAEAAGITTSVLRSRNAFTHRPFETAEEAIEFAQEVDPSLDFEGLALDSVEEVREHVIDCWEDFEPPTYDGRVL